MPSDIQQSHAKVEHPHRVERFGAVLTAFGASGPDATVPGAASMAERPARFAVVTESSKGHGYFVNYATTLAGVEAVAAANISEGWWPVCYYDLDDLAGDEPSPAEGDRVKYEQAEDPEEILHVVAATEDVAEGAMYMSLSLARDPDGFLDPDYLEVDEFEVTIVERAESDERMPVRYLLAKVVTTVVFNTTPDSTSRIGA